MRIALLPRTLPHGTIFRNNLIQAIFKLLAVSKKSSKFTILVVSNCFRDVFLLPSIQWMTILQDEFEVKSTVKYDMSGNTLLNL